jgi:hypothetical protein
MLVSSWVAELLVASQEGLISMEWVSSLVSKFNANLYSNTEAVTCGQMDGQTKLERAIFCNFSLGTRHNTRLISCRAAIYRSLR